MKTIVAFVVLLTGTFLTNTALAVPQFERVRGGFTGIVQQSVTINGVLTTSTKPLTKAWMLQLFGHPEVAPRAAFTFYDNVAGRYVLADSTAANIYGTILQFPASSVVSWDDNRRNAGYFGDTLNMFNDLVSGTETDVDTASVSSGRFLMLGIINQVPTIITGSYLVRF